MRQRVPKVVAIARWLATHDVPAARLVDDLPQPIEARGHLATVWHLVPETGPRPTGTDLARILCHIHRLSPPRFELPRWWPFNEIRQRLAEADGLDAGDLEFLHEHCDTIEEKLHDVRYVLPPGLLHGDAFLGNLLAGPTGPVICDFDSVSVGPREWDLTPVAVGKVRFDYPRDAHTELADAYGFDVMRWPGFPVLRQIRELQLVTSIVPILAVSPALREQWAHRLDTFKRADETAKWTTYR